MTLVALVLLYPLTAIEALPDILQSMNDNDQTKAPPSWGVMKVIEWKIHFLEFDPSENSRTWHTSEAKCTRIRDRGSAIRLAKAAGGLVIELDTGQIELPALD